MINYFRTDGWVKTSQGPAVPGAQIFVCLQPANLGFPPTPLANIFSDVNGLVPITQPIITDGFGHYDFYTQAGLYTVLVGLGGTIQQVYPDQSVGAFSNGGGTALILQVNGAPASSQLLQNLVGTGGATVVDQGSGTIAINTPVLNLQTNGVPNVVQSTQNLTGSGGLIVADLGNGTITITAPPTPPSGLTPGSVQWVPAFQVSTVSWIAIGDTTTGGDSGATPTYIPPTASSNAAFTLSGTRNYIGNTMIYGGRPANFRCVATFARGTDTLSVAALGLFSDILWAGFPFTITTTPCAAFHIPAGATTWFAITGDGASVTDVDTGISFTSRHVLAIDYTPTSVVFTIDGVIVATNTTTIPATSSLAMAEVNNRGLGASVPVLSVEYLNCNFTTV